MLADAIAEEFPVVDFDWLLGGWEASGACDDAERLLPQVAFTDRGIIVVRFLAIDGRLTPLVLALASSELALIDWLFAVVANTAEDARVVLAPDETVTKKALRSKIIPKSLP